MLGACTSPEELVVEEFLDASRNHEVQNLAELSTVPFPQPPRAWRLLEVSEEHVEDYALASLREELDAMRKERVKWHEELRRFRDRHSFDVARFEAGPEHVGDEAEELFERWRTLERADDELKSRLDELRRAVEREREGARKSLVTWDPIDEFDGRALVKEVLVVAELDDGSQQRFVITLKKYLLARPNDASEPESRWVVMGVAASGY
ncbi:MAG TPA: hypothetical protein VEK15_03820 [Vicinamibacteria bacterium]|nr:hypothetical protein [Vicinamibacteria bacterium]